MHQPRAHVHRSSSNVRPPCTASPSCGCVMRTQTVLMALMKLTVVSEAALLFINQSLTRLLRTHRRLWLELMWILHACTVPCLTDEGSALIKNHPELLLAASCNNSSGSVLLLKMSDLFWHYHIRNCLTFCSLPLPCDPVTERSDSLMVQFHVSWRWHCNINCSAE